MAEHTCDWKFAGVNPKIEQFGGARVPGKLFRCATCPAIQVRGTASTTGRRKKTKRKR